jgi:hypothetical protein
MRKAAALVLLLPLGACGGEPAGSALRWEQERLDLGVLHQWDEREFSLPFRIEGDAPVRLDALDVSCGCTDVSVVADGRIVMQAEKEKGAPGGGEGEEEKGLTAEAGDREILLPPGARGEVRGSYHPEKRLREQVVSISLRGSMLNSPARAEVRAKVEPLFKVEPPRVVFGTQVDAELDATPAVAEVAVQAARPFTIRSWTRVPEGLRVEETAPPEGGDGALRRYRFTLDGSAPRDTVDRVVVGSTSLGPELEILVSWRVVGPATYAPEERINFFNVPRGREHERILKIRPSKLGRALPEPRAEVLGEAGALLRVAVEPLPEEGGNAAGWKVRCVLPADAPAGACNGTLRISYPVGADLADHEMAVTIRVQEPR